MRADFHMHTKYSPDSFTTLKAVKKMCDRHGLFPVFTDHGTINGGLDYRKKYGECIVGEEIETKSGEVIGLYLNETIPNHLDLHETIDMIRAQDGLVYLPHPFDAVRSSSLKRHDVKADIVEVFNSRVAFQRYNEMAERFAEENGFLKAVGSDAHFGRHIGLCYAELPDFSGKKELLRSLKKAVLVKRKTPSFYLALSVGVYKFKKIFL